MNMELILIAFLLFFAVVLSVVVMSLFLLPLYKALISWLNRH